ncbi:sodium-coupled monocarboxylate transporter 1-like isoform X3 [Macrobrachium rosenbergii]|uniref:sodium-coupled monocarboxylate transporter 1-like isoform X3 n=1 Tax=Macrobrachium rosenbergii TaxID=79674 RepID=UPI0034D48311
MVVNAGRGETGFKNEEMSQNDRSFSAADYVVFIASLVISLGIGIYHWWKSRGMDNKDFLLGNRTMSPIPVAISLFAGVVSAVSILGNPSEMYFYGSQLWINCIGTIIGAILAGIFVVPVLYPLKLVSLYEGGAKAVVYTDTLQAFIMLAGILAVIIKGCSEVGGGTESWKIDEEHGRIEFSNMSSDPLIRHTFMSTIIQGIQNALSIFGAGQSQYQRWASVSTLREAYVVIAIACFLLVAIWSLINYSGLVVFSVYADCDPYTMGYITKTDQIIIYFVIDKLGYLQGIPGLFVAAIYSGVLSTVSSVLNAMAALVWEDLLSGLDRFSKFSPQQEKMATVFISSVIGVIATILGLTAGNMGGLFQMTYSLLGAISGPVTGLILLAVAFPWVKAKSAIIGTLLALILDLWMVMGSMLYAPPAEKLPLSTDGCPQTTLAANVTEGTTPFITSTFMSSTTDGGSSPESEVFPLYLVSYCLYGAIGILTTIVMANVATLIFGTQAISKVPKDTVHKRSLQFYAWMRSLLGKSDSRTNSETSIAKEGKDLEICKLDETSEEGTASLRSSTKSKNSAGKETQGSVNVAFDAENHM